MTQYRLPVYSIEDLEKANSYPPLENGRYKFRVLSKEQGTSKAGNHMEKLVLEVHHTPNRTMKCFHDFTFNSPEDKSHMWLIGNAKKFLDCIGVEYNEDAFERVVNREGYANFFVKEYTAKDGSKKEKFVVPPEGFLSPEDLKNPVAPTPTATKAAERFDDDIPF
jgi:hypothetical protein